MKLVLPAGAIAFGAGFCCCCGDMLTPILQELGVPSDVISQVSGEEAATTPATEPVGTTQETTEAPPAATPAPEAAAPAPSTVSTTICGPFADQKLDIPGSFSVVSCSTSSTTSSIMMTGTTPARAVCNPMRDWADSAGWQMQNQAATDDTVALTFSKGSERLTIACSSSTGTTTVSAAIVPG